MTAFGVRSYVPGDPKGEWGHVSPSLGTEPFTLGRGSPPGSIRSTPVIDQLTCDVSWISEVRGRRITLLQPLAETALDRRLQPVERNALYLALTASPRPSGVGPTAPPVLPDIVAALMRPTQEMATLLLCRPRRVGPGIRVTTLELRRLVVGDLAGLFDGPTTHPLDFDVPMQVVDTSRLSGDDTAIALVMSCASAWMEAAISDPTRGAGSSCTTRRGG